MGYNSYMGYMGETVPTGRAQGLPEPRKSDFTHLTHVAL
jgi:hypothetical protein